MNRLEQIRKNERLSHIDVYTRYGLYQDGSWLKKPVRTVLDLLSHFEAYPSLRVLDLGCGIGRNCIPIAAQFHKRSCRIDCVDILELAIEKLVENAAEYGVLDCIHGYTIPLESFSIPENTYDLILAISALEHIDCETAFEQKLRDIKNGIRKNGIFCLIMNTSVIEFDKYTGQEIPAQFEVNMPQERLQLILQRIFSGWTVLKKTSNEQHYSVSRGDTISDLHTCVVTFVVKKQI